MAPPQFAQQRIADAYGAEGQKPPPVREMERMLHAISWREFDEDPEIVFANLLGEIASPGTNKEMLKRLYPGGLPAFGNPGRHALLRECYYVIEAYEARLPDENARKRLAAYTKFKDGMEAVLPFVEHVFNGRGAPPRMDAAVELLGLIKGKGPYQSWMSKVAFRIMWAFGYQKKKDLSKPEVTIGAAKIVRAANLRGVVSRSWWKLA
jgi:hypothetical protein